MDPTLTDIAARLQQARAVAIFTHQRPDPDALGSQSAAALLLRKAVPAARVAVVTFEPPPAHYAFLLQDLAGVDVVTFSPALAAADYETILVVDTCTYSQMEPAREFLKAASGKVVAIDHHATRDALGAMLHTDTTAAAAAELITELADHLGVPIDAPIANRLLAGIVGDTGWFRFDNVTPRTHRHAARLVAAGAEPAKLYERLMQGETAPKLALIQRALASLRWSAGGRVAVMHLLLRDFADTSATMSQTEYLVDLPMQVATTEISALLTELSDGRFRLSLRSKRYADVNAICRTFGGGGHVRAAGARLDGPLDSARTRVEAAAAKAIQSGE